MKKLLLCIIIAIMAIPLLSCSDEEPAPPAAIDFVGGQNDSSLNFSHQSSTQSVVFSSNYDWTATPSDEWIKVTPESGKAGEKCDIVVSLDANDTYEKRSGSIVINAKELNVVLTVSQEQNNAIILSTPTVNLPQAGGAFTVKLKANINYEYEIKADWIKSVETRALKEYSLRFEAEANPSYDERKGDIVIKGEGFSETITVTQAQTAVISLSTTEQNFDSEGGTFEVEVEHSVDYDVKISDDWVTQIESRAVETTTLHFAVAENTTYGERKATITIKGGDITETIAVVQTQNNSIILSTPTVNLPQAGGAFTVKLKANIDYEYEIKADWIKSVETRALKEYSLRFEAETNPSFDKRVGEIVIKGGGFSEIVTITQAQTNMLTLSTTSQNFACTGGEFSVEVQHNIDYTVKISENWVTQIESRAVTTSTIHFIVAENTTSERRNATITISGDGISETITIEQDEFSLPHNQLRYTTINGEILPLNDTSVFGANITSHTYLNGQGIITFDAPVTSIGDKAFEWCSALTSITIPDSVTSIGDYAFYNCTSLTSVTIGNSVTSIGRSAFSGCTSLTSAKIGNSVTSFGDNTFYNCTSLTSITIPDSVTLIGSKAFYECSSLTSVTIGNSVTTIGSYAFSGCTSLTSATITNSVTSIGEGAFQSCRSLTSVTIPDSVTEIGYKAFEGCAGELVINSRNIVEQSYDYDKRPVNDTSGWLYGAAFTKLTIGNNITEIGDYAFYECTSLTSVLIPYSVTWIGYYAFYNCSSLTSITIPGSVIWIEIGAFSNCTLLRNTYVNITDLAAYCVNNVIYKVPGAKHLCVNSEEVKELVIPNGVTEIGSYTFSGCTSLTSATITNSVTSIGERAFQSCRSLTSVTIPDSVTEIGYKAFEGCRGELVINNRNFIEQSYDYDKRPVNDTSGWLYGAAFTKLTIGNNITKIGSYAFYKCTSLKSVTIPDSVTSIEDNTFKFCESLTSVTIGNSVTSIGDVAFYGCTSLKGVDITDLSAWCKINFGDSSANPLYNGAKLYLNGSELTDITILSDIAEIKSCAFNGCTSLTSVTIPDSVALIGSCAFKDCSSLTSVTIGNSVTSIGDSAFSGCSSLTSVTIPDSVTLIGGYAFRDCTSLTSITIPDSVTSIGDRAFYSCDSLTSVTIPDSVTSIGDDAFRDCTSLTSVTIGNGVTEIGEEAFYDCISLTSVTIPDSIIKISNNVFNGCLSLKDTYVNITDLPKYCTSNPMSNIPGSKHILVNGVEVKELEIPDSVTSIGSSAFIGCSLLTSVIIPNSVTSIGGGAFENCTSLKEINCQPTVPPSLGKNAFNGNATARVIYVPANSVSRYQTNWSGYKYAITYEGGPLPLKVGDLVSKNGATGVVYYADDSSIEIVSVEETSADWYSAKTWCENYGSGWCLPSTFTLQRIYNNASVINSTLSANGCTSLGTGYYWSSTEYNDSFAYRLNFSNGYSGYYNKNYTGNVRAVLAF